MCTHTYIVPDNRKPRPNGNRCPYPHIYASHEKTDPQTSGNDALPIDSQGTCIFHSNDVEWKRRHDFVGKFRELLMMLDGAGLAYDFAEFVMVGNELKIGRGPERHILRMPNAIFRKEAIFHGASFLDEVEFEDVVFERGGTFTRAHFSHSIKLARCRCNSLDFEKSVFDGLVFLVKVQCDGQALFSDAHFTGTTDGWVFKAEDVQFGGMTMFTDASFLLGDESASGFRNVVFEDLADFSNVRFRCHVVFDGVSFAGVTEFIDTMFDSVGTTARYRGAAVEFNNIEVTATGSLTFMSTDVNRKLFNHEARITFKDQPAGVVRFENVHFNRIVARDQLLTLAKLGLVEIGAGCIKYRLQTGVRTILMERGTAPLVVELCQTFTNYFTASNSLNLGLEIVERDKSKISLFYFTDEDISDEEFQARLAQTERQMWNLLATNSGEILLQGQEAPGATLAVSRQNALINAVDGVSALLGIFFRVGVRIAVGSWREKDTRALMGAIRFNDEGAERRASTLHQVLAEKYTGQTLFLLSAQQNHILSPIIGKGEIVPPDRRIKILFLGANSSGSRLDLEKEVGKIQNNLKLARERDNLVLKQEWAVTVDSLMQAMLDEAPTIVHFSGHGGQSGIILRDEAGNPKIVSSNALAKLFKLFKETVQCVVLNACYSELQAQAIRQHIPYVIGMRSSILDTAAIAFATGFYKAIGAGRDVPFAFDMGEASMRLESTGDEDIPVLI